MKNLAIILYIVSIIGFIGSLIYMIFTLNNPLSATTTMWGAYKTYFVSYWHVYILMIGFGAMAQCLLYQIKKQ